MTRQAETAIAAYRDLEPVLNERQQQVRRLLAEFQAKYDCWPTALELLRYATATYAACRNFDVNSIRPRLFELHEQGYVAHGAKRKCVVSDKRVYTWVATRPVAPRYDDLAQARQVELF